MNEGQDPSLAGTSEQRRGGLARDPFWLFILLVPPWLIFPNLGANILWQDEAETATLARRIVEYGYPLADDGRPPLDKHGHSLHAVTDQQLRGDGSYVDINEDGIWIWTSWFGNYLTAASLLAFDAVGFNDTIERQTIAARLPFALGAWLTLAVMYVALLDMTGRRALSRVAVMLLALNVPYLLFARQCRSYPFLAMYTLVQVWGYVRMTREHRRGSALFVLGGLGSFYTFFPTMVGVTGGLGVHALLKHGVIRYDEAKGRLLTRLRHSVFLRYVVACMLVAGLTAPFFIYTRSWDRDYDDSGVPIKESWSRLVASLRAYLVHLHTGAWPFVLLVPIALSWAAARRRAVFAVLTLATGAAWLAVTAATMRGLHAEGLLEWSWRATDIADHFRVMLHNAPLGMLAAGLLLLAVFVFGLLALAAGAGVGESASRGRWWTGLAALACAVLFFAVMVAPASSGSFFILLGFFAAACAGTGLWIVRSSFASLRDAAWFDTDWKQITIVAGLAVVFSASALANHPFYRYLLGGAALFSLAAAACVLKLSGGRTWVGALVFAVVVGCELFQYGPFYVARRLVLEPRHQASIVRIQEEYLEQGDPEPTAKAHNEAYFAATEFGHLNANGYTWTMLYKNGRLDKFGMPVELEFPLLNLVRELRNDYEGPIEAVIRHLQAHARKDDLVTTVYEHFPLKYYTDLLVIRTRDLVPRVGPRLPDWIIAQHWDYRSGLPAGVRDKLRDAAFYEWVRLPEEPAAIQWDNIPEPAWHHFTTVKDRPLKLRFWRLREEAKVRAYKRQTESVRGDIQTVP